MVEKPPMMPSEPKPERRLEDMTLIELEEKIRELTVDLDNAAKSNRGRELEGILTEMINERARYMMRKYELLQKGLEKPE